MSLSEMGLRLLCWFKKNEFNVLTILVFSEKISSPSIKGTVSPPERCEFTSSQQYNNNVL